MNPTVTQTQISDREWAPPHEMTSGAQVSVAAAGPQHASAVAHERPNFVGRAAETTRIDRMLEWAPDRGGALVIRGEAGIGKSALLRWARFAAARRHLCVVRTEGVHSEIDLDFSGLHHILRSLLPYAQKLPAIQRKAVNAAFGMSEGVEADLFLVALAALQLLSEAASHTPLVLIIDDAHWLDPATSDVLAFVGRRVESERLVLLTAVSDGHGSPLLDAAIPELRLERLGELSARDLLHDRFPRLAPWVRRRVISEADGNPLALLELPAALGSAARAGAELLPFRLPVTARIERTFATTLNELPDRTRVLLLVAAADETAGLSDVLQAAAAIRGTPVTVEDLVPATQVGLIRVDGPTIRFRHSLARSAVYLSATVAELHAAHAALAAVLADDPDRSVWHRAAARIGVDRTLASDLEDAGRRAQRRGSIANAAAAFERAAELTPACDERARLLLSAAEAALELGTGEVVLQLVRQAESAGLEDHDQARAMWLEDAFRPGPVGDPARVSALVRAAERLAAGGETETTLNLLSSAAFRTYWGNLDRGPGRAILQVADCLGVAPNDPRLLQIQAYAAPTERGARVIAELPDVSQSGDPETLLLLGTAACTVGAFGRASLLLEAAIAQLRPQGSIRALAQALERRAWSAVMIGDYHVAATLAEEAGMLAAELGQSLWQTGASIAQAMLAAVRGDSVSADRLMNAVQQGCLSTGARGLLGPAQHARGVAALSRGQHDDAYEQLRRIYEPTDPAYHRVVGCCAAGDMAEAAVRTGNVDEARWLIASLEQLPALTPYPWFQSSLKHARALLADDHEAEDRFTEAVAWSKTMPFTRARLLLALGEWLRRRRRVADSRSPLRAARDAFDALGADAWGDRAREELRASGESRKRHTWNTLDWLTPQELQIVQLAAGGLSNREIGRRLYLSHRTVESHLYRVFPRLGISSRSQLAGALRGDEFTVKTPA